LPAFARNVLANMHVPEETVHPVEQTLANGIKLVVVPSQVSKTVVVRGKIANNAGVEDPPGKDGIDDIVDALFSFGTTTYDRIAYQTELDKIAANESAGHDFSLDVLSQRLRSRRGSARRQRAAPGLSGASVPDRQAANRRRS
jgi:zinc protease